MTEVMTKAPSSTLISYAADRIRLSKALEKASKQLQGAIGLFYSPAACHVGRIDQNGQVEVLTQNRAKTWESKLLDLGPVFEARLFNKTSELTWLNSTTDEGGRAVLMTDQAAAVDSFSENGALKADAVLEQSYLVWGKYDKVTEQLSSSDKESWAIVSTSQIGQLAVPRAYKETKEFVLLHSREYLTKDDCGNAYVKYERLLNLSWEKTEEKDNG